MKPLDAINGLTIASPCPASWNAMAGDDRARHCGLCDKQVYNVAAMTGPDVVDLIRRTEGEFCARLYRRRVRALSDVILILMPAGSKLLNSFCLRTFLSLPNMIQVMNALY